MFFSKTLGLSPDDDHCLASLACEEVFDDDSSGTCENGTWSSLLVAWDISASSRSTVTSQCRASRQSHRHPSNSWVDMGSECRGESSRTVLYDPFNTRECIRLQKHRCYCFDRISSYLQLHRLPHGVSFCWMIPSRKIHICCFCGQPKFVMVLGIAEALSGRILLAIIRTGVFVWNVIWNTLVLFCADYSLSMI